LVFIFAINQRTQVKVHVLGKSQANVHGKNQQAQLPPIESKLSLAGSQVMRLNRDLEMNQNAASNRIRTISRRNLRLALITVISTAITMLVLSIVEVASPGKNSPLAESYYYTRNIAQSVGTLDLVVNALAMVMMTPTWQSASLRQFSKRFSPASVAINARQNGAESEVSSLGGGQG
jgi:hypothetical protein